MNLLATQMVVAVAVFAVGDVQHDFRKTAFGTNWCASGWGKRLAKVPMKCLKE